MTCEKAKAARGPTDRHGGSGTMARDIISFSWMDVGTHVTVSFITISYRERRQRQNISLDRVRFIPLLAACPVTLHHLIQPLTAWL